MVADLAMIRAQGHSSVPGQRRRRRSLPTAPGLGLLALLILAWALGSVAAAEGQDVQDRARWAWDQPRLAQQGYPQQGHPWIFRPQAPTNARGVPPAPTSGQQSGAGYPRTGQWPPRTPTQSGAALPGPFSSAYPAQQPRSYPSYQPYQQGATAYAQPSLEVSVLDSRPYVQQRVLVRLDVLSSGNLATASPALTGFDGVLLEEISGPVTSVRSSGRTRQIVNSYMLAMTPLRAGPLEIGWFKVSGTLAGGVPFTATASAASRIEVRPAIDAVRPWLPLQALQLTREIDETKRLSQGQPTTLTLRMLATGGTGAQLPDLEPMLVSSDFRAYRERTIIDTRLSDDGHRLEGTRTEIYTLVPYSGGRLQLPELRITWWNVDSERSESSSVPIQSVSVEGESGPFGLRPRSGWLSEGIGRLAVDGSDSWKDHDGQGWRWFWIPVGGIMLLLIGYWAGVWLRLSRPEANAQAARRRPTMIRIGLRRTLGGTGGGTGVSIGRRLRGALRNAIKWLDPRPPAAALRLALAAQLSKLIPASLRVYHCAREAEHASSPSEWTLRFQSSACRSLRAPSREPLPRMADRILQLRPGADGARVRRLIDELDRALYNRGELDMRRWKRELRQALRPGWGGWRGLFSGRLQRRRLPALNPRASQR